MRIDGKSDQRTGPNSGPNQQLNLFSETKTGYEIRSVSLDFKKETKQSLEQKTEQLKKVIISAEEKKRRGY